MRRVELVSTADELATLLDTVSLFAVNPGREADRQNDVFINYVIEEIALRSTLTLPNVTIESLKQDKRAESRVIVNTAGNAAIAGLGDFISGVLRYATNVAMTHMVTQSLYGIFIAISTLATIVGGAAKLGLDSSTLRFLSLYRVKGERGLAAGVVRFSVWVTLISSCIFALLLFFSATSLASLLYHSVVYDVPLREMALVVPLVSLQFVLASGLQALRVIKWKVYVDRLIQPALTLVMMVGLYLVGWRLEALIYATIFGYFISVIAGQFLLHKATKKLVRGARHRYEARTWVRFSLPMFLNSIIRNLLNTTDILFLTFFATPALVGLYGAADRVTLFIVMPLVALSVIFSSVIAEHHSLGQHAQLEKMFSVVTKWSFSLSLPMFLCCLIFHDAILGIFGDKYIAGGWVLIILSLGNFVDAGAGLVGQLLSMTGHPRVVLVNTFITIIVNVGLALLLVPRYSVIGAAVAAALGVSIFNILSLVVIYRTMRIQPYRWDYLKPVVAGIVASLVGIALMQFIRTGYGHSALFGVLGLIVPFAATYVLVLALLRFSEEDMIVFRMIYAKFGSNKRA